MPRRKPLGQNLKRTQKTTGGLSTQASTPWESRQIVGLDPYEIYVKRGLRPIGTTTHGHDSYGKDGHGHDANGHGADDHDKKGHGKKGEKHHAPQHAPKSGFSQAAAPPPETCSGVLHQVRKGDTLYQLAVANCLTLEAILAANPQITDPDQLTVGQMVCIPQGSESLMEIINTLLTAERIEVALYAKGLKSPALKGLPPEQYAYFQAALSHEAAHANTLMSLGASVPYTEFYYPPGTFEDRDVFLNTILMIETAGVAAYTQASVEFARMGRLDLSRLADRILGVEAEHRTLIRSVLDLIPANNLCFENVPNEPVTVILAAIPNFLLPDQFNGSSVGPVPLPSAAKVDELVGPNGCPNPTP